MTEVLTLKSENHTKKFAEEISKELLPGDILLLEGTLGTGKTTFVRFLVEALSGNPLMVSSPTYNIMHQYEIKNNGDLIHVDAFRLNSIEELEDIAFFELAKDNISCIEWPSKIFSKEDTKKYWRFSFSHEEELVRKVSYERAV